MLPTVLFIPDRAEATSSPFKSAWQMVATTFSQPLRYPSFIWLMASRLLILMGLVGLQSFILYYFSDVFFHGHVDRAVRAAYMLQGLVIVSALIVALPAARSSDRIGRRPLILVGGMLGAAGVLLLVFSHYELLPYSVLHPLAHALHVPRLAAQATLVGILIGIGYGLFFSVDWAFIQDIIPPNEAGLYMGFSNIATAGSGVIARFVGGFLLEFNNGPQLLGLPGGYPVIFTVFFIWLLVGGLLILKVPEMRKT
jgi:MFS family permease